MDPLQDGPLTRWTLTGAGIPEMLGLAEEQDQRDDDQEHDAHQPEYVQ